MKLLLTLILAAALVAADDSSNDDIEGHTSESSDSSNDDDIEGRTSTRGAQGVGRHTAGSYDDDDGQKTVINVAIAAGSSDKHNPGPNHHSTIINSVVNVNNAISNVKPKPGNLVGVNPAAGGGIHTFGGASPSVGNIAPATGGITPVVTGSATGHGGVPHLAGGDPIALDDFAHTGAPNPIKAVGPHVLNGHVHFEDEYSHDIGGVNTQVGGLSPLAGEFSPAAGGVPSLASGFSPVAGGVPPLASGFSPVAGGVPPLAGGFGPVAGGVPPLAGGFSPVAGGVPPLAGGFSPVAGGVPPHSSGFIPVAGAINPAAAGPCRYWCRSPRGQYYCCQTPEQSQVLTGLSKPGRCPPVRPLCPQVKLVTPPQPCVNDALCSGYDKCCYDTCLQEHVCKPPYGFGR
ncbi:SUMO-interacting motif-containing protein 1-like [Palaemon carinicauda]|uniref:SUMO-interacting motif-containing protein 1-like n=1 Tax=Palaemon carinicauda TaxID=392227 RepID=UPI0035B6445B